MVDELQNNIVSYLLDIKDKGIVLPQKPSESKYNNIPTNLGEINGFVLANYLSHWTAVTNWAGYNLASLRAKEDILKRQLARARKLAYLTVSESHTIKDKEARADTAPEVMELEDQYHAVMLQSEMLSAVFESNVRTLSLFSREISRRSVSTREDFSGYNDTSTILEESEESEDF